MLMLLLLLLLLLLLIMTMIIMMIIIIIMIYPYPGLPEARGLGDRREGRFYYMFLYSTALLYIVLCYTMLYSIVFYSTLLYSTLLYFTLGRHGAPGHCPGRSRQPSGPEHRGPPEGVLHIEYIANTQE